MGIKTTSAAWCEGKVEISVLDKHLNDAMARNSSHCATAEAIKEQVPEARFIAVDLQTIRWSDPKRGLRYVFLTPHAIQSDVIVPFDQGERQNCKPVTVRMKPAFVTKCGRKSQRHTPDPEQLKQLGLKVADVQAHIPTSKSPNVGLESAPPAPDPEQQLAAMWKPERDPWAGRDRPAAEADEADPIEPAPKPKRVARAKVSAAPKGSIPTTLGGKLPPVSVLARREFGLRALRR
jgi:hypothetical protein